MTHAAHTLEETAHPTGADRKKSLQVSRAVPKKIHNVHLINGRVVSASLADPEVNAQVSAAMAVFRKSKKSLLQFYVDQGLLTADGKLAKSFGG